MLKNKKPTINVNYPRIWQTVQLIPYGKVACYGQLADLAGLPGKARLVGKALGEVPDDGWKGKSVPWHRIINAQGKISFTVESELFAKQSARLKEEEVVVIGNRVKLIDFQWQPDLAELLFKLTF